jgi:hypothetical protein
VTELTLHTTLGHLDPTTVTISATGRGESTLRSSGIGTASVTLVDEAYEADAVAVDFPWPWVLSIALVLGAVVGGFLGQLAGGRFVVSALVGIVIGIAWCAGIRLTSIDLGTPVTAASAFVAAALYGFVKWVPKPLGWTKEE